MLNRLLIVAAAVALALPLSPARAAPQVLGLLALDAPVPLPCFAGECSAEFTAFCLQRGRPIPTPGTAYRPAGDSFTLIALAADGSSRRLPGADYLTLETTRGFSAIKISISSRALEALGAERVAVEVGENVSLVPVPVIGDTNPQSDLEIATATGPLRALGTQIVDNGGADAGATRLTADMLNALPDKGRVDIETAEALWRRTLEESGADEASVAAAGEVYDFCRVQVEDGWDFTLRNCLEKRHSAGVLDLNARYWRAAVGS